MKTDGNKQHSTSDRKELDQLSLPSSPQAKPSCESLPQGHLSAMNKVHFLNASGFILIPLFIGCFYLFFIKETRKNKELFLEEPGKTKNFVVLKSKRNNESIITCLDISRAMSSAMPVPAWNHETTNETTQQSSSTRDISEGHWTGEGTPIENIYNK